MVNQVGRFAHDVQALAFFPGHDELSTLLTNFLENRVRTASEQFGGVGRFGIGMTPRSKGIGEAMQNVVGGHLVYISLGSFKIGSAGTQRSPASSRKKQLSRPV